MSKKKRLFKKKGNIIKDLTKKVVKEFSSAPNQSFNYKQIASKLGLNDAKSREQIVKKLAELKAQEKIVETSRGKYKANLHKHYVEGVIDMTSTGNAYLVADTLEHDVFIPSINVNKAMHQDRVKVYMYKRKRNGKFEGDVVEILERAKNSFVGVLQMNKNFGFVIPDDPKMYADIFIAKNKLNGAEDGEKVMADITDWPENSKNPFGKITTVLGPPGDHQTEIHSILLEYGLPYEFPKEVEEQAAALPIEITSEEVSKRRDMRDVLTFTIDPKDAKDFDDALSFQILENGNYEIGIHIADVSHYVQPDTILDDEAYDRATSVYLVDRVVPMLPEVLSNNVCSLRPEEEKLTFSAIFEINNEGQILKEWFGRTVTYSDRRFTYEEAQQVIETQEGECKEAILTLDRLAKILRQKRMKEGAISFDKVEVRFDLDDAFEPTGVYFKESKDSNKLIEEFMLLANRKVAEFIGKEHGKASDKTFIYRIHDEPDEDKLASLQNIVKKFGYDLNTVDRKSTTDSLNKLLKDVHGKAESNMVETLAIRSMSKAVYTTQNIGHYGLAFDYYSHFTSPIRRYPDVMTHRLLQHYLDQGKTPKAEVYEEKCKHSSEREQLASKAERDSIKYMQVKFMDQHKDQEFDGVITGVTEWGIYVEILENKCEGMVRIKDLKDDYYIFDEEQYALVGQSNGLLYQLGDYVTIKVKKTDLERKHLDFDLLKRIQISF